MKLDNELVLLEEADQEYIKKIMVYWYTNNPSMIDFLDEFCSLAEANGFIVEGKPIDTNSDKPDYYGKRVSIIMKYKGEN